MALTQADSRGSPTSASFLMAFLCFASCGATLAILGSLLLLSKPLTKTSNEALSSGDMGVPKPMPAKPNDAESIDEAIEAVSGPPPRCPKPVEPLVEVRPGPPQEALLVLATTI